MDDSNQFYDDGYSNELAIARRLKDYVANCVASLPSQTLVRSSVVPRAGANEIVCEVDVEPESLQSAIALVRNELRVISENRNGVTIEWDAIIPAIVKSEHNHANQLFRVVMRSIDIAVSSAEEFILPLRPQNRAIGSETSTNSDPNYGLPAADVKHVIVLIHGIKDIGAWHTKVSNQLKMQGTVVKQIRYGLYPAIRFLFPIDLSGRPIGRVLDGLQDLRMQYPNAKFSVIAHSFGTYVFLRAMEKDPHPIFWKVIFCGSVADDLFRWAIHHRRVGDGKRQTSDFILNDCGTGDVWPVVGASFGWHYGMAGCTGFSDEYVRNRFHRARGAKNVDHSRWWDRLLTTLGFHTKGGHGLYFDPDFVRNNWRPFLIDDTAPTDGDGEQGEHLPWLVCILYHGWVRLICKIISLIIWLTTILGIAWAAWYLASLLINLVK